MPEEGTTNHAESHPCKSSSHLNTPNTQAPHAHPPTHAAHEPPANNTPQTHAPDHHGTHHTQDTPLLLTQTTDYPRSPHPQDPTMNNPPLICRKGTLQGPDHVQSLTFRQRLPDRWRPLQPQPVLDETRTYSVFALARTRDERLSRSRTRRGIRGATRFARFATIPGGSAKPQSSHRPDWGPEAPGQEPSRVSLSVATSIRSETPVGFHRSAYAP